MQHISHVNNSSDLNQIKQYLVYVTCKYATRTVKFTSILLPVLLNLLCIRNIQELVLVFFLFTSHLLKQRARDQTHDLCETTCEGQTKLCARLAYTIFSFANSSMYICVRYLLPLHTLISVISKYLEKNFTYFYYNKLESDTASENQSF